MSQYSSCNEVNGVMFLCPQFLSKSIVYLDSTGIRYWTKLYQVLPARHEHNMNMSQSSVVTQISVQTSRSSLETSGTGQ